MPELVAHVQQVGRDAKNAFFEATGHVSHIPEPPIAVADSTPAAIRGLNFETLWETAAIFLSVRKGHGGGVGDVLGANATGS